MALIYILFIGVMSIFACMVVAAIIADPTLPWQFIMVMWKLLGTPESPFFWMLTGPALLIFVLFGLYVIYLKIARPV